MAESTPDNGAKSPRPDQQRREERGAPRSTSPPNDDLSPEERRARVARAAQIIWYVTGILEAFLGLRFLMKLMAANPSAGFSRFIYGLTEVFLVPFVGLFSTPIAGNVILELSTLFAMVVYALIAWGVVRAVWLVFTDR